VSHRTNIQIGRVLVLIAFIVAWQAIVEGFSVPAFVVPAPTLLASRAYSIFAQGILWPHLLTTLGEILLGLLLGAAAGFLIGVLVALVPLVEDLIYPYLVAVQTLPKVAIAPLLIIWFGYGTTSKVVTAAMVAFFPMLVNVITGFHTADRDQVDMMKAFGANRWQTFLHLRLPNALPMIFAGLEIAAVFAVIGAIVGEFVGAQSGLGYLITVWNYQLDVAGVFTILIVLSVIGLVLHGLVTVAARRTVFWIRRTRDEGVVSV
jgi:NitT/TauT family transport system permease protein